MDYKKFFDLVQEEKAYLSAFDVTGDPRECKALGAIYEIEGYLQGQMLKKNERYEPEETEKMREIVEIFEEYIHDSPVFDIYFSKKFGCIKVYFYSDDEADGGVQRYYTSEELFDGILDEIFSDVRELQLDGEHKTPGATYREAVEVCNRVQRILMNKKSDVAYYMKLLEDFIEDHVDHPEDQEEE